MTRRAILSALLLVFVPIASLAQQRAASPIDGVWRITERADTGANSSTIKSPQPSLLIFAFGHYSWLSINGTEPRKQPAALVEGKLTDADKIARFEEWQPLTANSGTFEVKGSSLITRPLVAKNVGVMASTDPVVREFKLEGDTLWLTQRSTGASPGEVRFRLTRVR